MSHYLPDVIYQFFLPNEEGPTLPPCPQKRKNFLPFDPVSKVVGHLPELPPPRQYTTKAQEDAAIRAEKEEQNAIKIALERQEYDRFADPLEENTRLTGNPKNTLFVGRLDYRVTTEMLMEEFKMFGNVIHAHVVRDPITQQSRGYGFVEYEHEDEKMRAYHNADKQKILDRHIVVDNERRRLDMSFYPRRLGGGLGQTRAARKCDRVKEPGRIEDYYRARDEERRRQEEMQRHQRYSRFDRRGGGGGGYRSGGGGGGGYRNDYRGGGGNRDYYQSNDRDRDRGSGGGRGGYRGGGGGDYGRDRQREYYRPNQYRGDGGNSGGGYSSHGGYNANHRSSGGGGGGGSSSGGGGGGGQYYD